MAVQWAALAVGIPAHGHHQGVRSGGRLHAGVAQERVAGQTVLEGRVVLGQQRVGGHGVHGRKLGWKGQSVGRGRGRSRGRGAARRRGRRDQTEGRRPEVVLGGQNRRTENRLGLRRAAGGARPGRVDPGRLPGRGLVAAGRRALTTVGRHLPAPGRRGTLIAGASLFAAAVPGRPGPAARVRVRRRNALLLGTGGGLVAAYAGLVGLEAAGFVALQRRGGGRRRRRIVVVVVVVSQQGRRLLSTRRIRLARRFGFVGRCQERFAGRQIHADLTARLSQKRQRTLLGVQLQHKRGRKRKFSRGEFIKRAKRGFTRR